MKPSAATPMGLAQVHVRAGEKVAVDVWMVTPPESRAELGMKLDPIDDRIVVESVVPGGPAASAGIAPGDEVLSVDGGAVAGTGGAARVYLTSRPPGTSVALSLRRAGRETHAILVVGEPQR